MPDQRVPPAGSPATANRAHARSTALDSSGATPCNSNNNSSGNTNPTAKPSSSSSSSTSQSSSSLSTPTPPQPRAPPPRRLKISLALIVLLLLSALAVAVLSAWFAIWGSTTTAAEVLVSHSEVVPALSDIGGGAELSISSLGRGGNSGRVLASSSSSSSSSSSFLSFLSAASSSSSSSLPFSSASSSSSLSLSSPPPSTTAPLSPSCSSSSSSSSSSPASLDHPRSFPSAAPSSPSPPSPPPSPPSPSTSAASQSQPQSPQSSENPPIVKQHYSNNVNANTDNRNNNNNDNDSPHPHPHHNNHIHHNNNHNASSAMTSTSVIVAATAHDDLNHVPTLPPTTSLSYLAEGAANVIYRLSSPPGAPQFPGQLLRLRKALPSAQPNKLAYAHLLHTFHPLFPDHLLLPTSLIRIPASLLVRENTALRALEAANKRPAKRVGLYLEEVDEQFGFLIMDMSPHPLLTPPSSPSPPSPPLLASPPSSPGFFARMLSFLPGRLRRRTASTSSSDSSSASSSSSKRTSSSSSAGSASSSSDPDLSLPAHAQRTRQLLIEFKPKWVLQSRSAPDGWRRCRTCALRLSKHQKLGFCPLDLASGDEARVRRAVAHIVPARAPKNLVLGPGMSWEATQAVICERLLRYVLEGDLMVELKRLHSELDPYGPVAAQGMGREVRERFVSAMTVRDLTIFLRIDLERGEGEAGAVEARIGDLDLKTGEAGKWAYWAGVEAKLREEGYYGGTEEGAEEKGVWCRL